MDNVALVSVIVITYNSAMTVTETLDSIKNQDYPNIELIVTDDCSKDDTVKVVKDWIDLYGSCFVRSELVTTTRNTGVSGNLNRGVANARGTWIKPIAGDDILLPECISVNIKCAETDSRICAVFSRSQVFGDSEACKQFENFGYGLFGLNNREKYLILLTFNTIMASATFMSRTYLESVGGYNESIPFIEDWPFWIRMFRDNCNVEFINKETVKYRVGYSLSVGGGGGERFQDSYKKVLEYAYELQMKENPIYRRYAFLSKKLREKYSSWYSLQRKLNVYYYYYKFLRRKMDRASIKFNQLHDK